MSGQSVAPSAKERLLDAVIEHFSVDGLADQSLRRIAEAVGSSHRMLLYHFGSKDGLLLEVVRAVEARTQAEFAAIGAEAGGESDELVRRMWAHVADPAWADFERLFFAVDGRALQGDVSTLPLLRHDLEGWLETNVAVAAALGVPADVTRVHARLGLAVTWRVAARPPRHGGPRRCRRGRRGVRPALRRTLVGGRGARGSRGSRHRHQRPRLVAAAVAGGDHEGHCGPHLDPPAAVRDGGGVEPEAGPASSCTVPRPRAASKEVTRP